VAQMTDYVNLAQMKWQMVGLKNIDSAAWISIYLNFEWNF
jgi:hypothetical protein